MISKDILSQGPVMKNSLPRKTEVLPLVDSKIQVLCCCVRRSSLFSGFVLDLIGTATY